MKRVLFVTVIGLSFGFFVHTPTAMGHAVLDKLMAPSGSFYKGVITITHGCKGSATNVVRVQIPLGVKLAKPMPKHGWEVKTVVKKLDEPYDFHGRTITEDVRELIWSGGSLLNEFIDEFVFQVLLPEGIGKVIYFKTLQECERGVHRWIETPEPGKSRRDYREPAPGLILTGRP